MSFTAQWGWPQWMLIVWMFLSFMVEAVQHGTPRLQTAGVHKGEPFDHNGFVALGKMGFIIFILIAGGFFR
jgi:hypothetical protein